MLFMPHVSRSNLVLEGYKCLLFLTAAFDNKLISSNIVTKNLTYYYLAKHSSLEPQFCINNLKMSLYKFLEVSR